MEVSLDRSAGPQVDAADRNPVADALLRFALFYLFLSNWIWIDDLIYRPARPIRPIFNGIFGSLARWSGRDLFHLAGPLEPNSFRDTRYLYLLLFVLAVISLALAAVWIVADRAGRSVGPAYRTMRVWIRYTLAYMILMYAMDKIFRIQFQFPSLQRLTETYGRSSPMALLWTYVGYSATLTIFSGAAEATGAVLLLFRRTAPLGALICVVMMANVAIMDFCYDVSVKMLAAHFLAMSVFLLAHDARRLLSVLVFNRPAPARDLESDSLPISNPRIRKFLPALKTLVVLYTVLPVIPRDYKKSHAMGALAPRPALYGLYKVESASIDGVNRPLPIGDGGLLEYIAIEKPSSVSVTSMDGSVIAADSSYNPASSTLEARQKNAASPLDLTIKPEGTAQEPDAIVVSGTQGKHHIVERLVRVDPKSFTLVNRGFHWINQNSFFK